MEGIAVIGMAGRFPGADSVEALWRVLDEGRDIVEDYVDAELRAAGVDAATLAHPDYVRSGSYLPDVSLFDAAFFGYTGREAEMMDPQQRIFLEVCQTALEESGHGPTTFHKPIGVYAGIRRSEYNNLLSGPDYDDVTTEFAKLANAPDALATKVAYKLDCTGPALTVETACSSSLVAVHLAARALRGGDCDLALAGGVSLRPRQHVGYLYREGGTFSRTGRCRPFDRAADGIIFADGAAVVVLRRLADALADGDQILAVVLGSAVTNDGALRRGYTAPGVAGQARAVREAIGAAGIKATDVSYVETHGAGTPVGDEVEVRALTEAFDTDQKAFCGIGSVKSNLGHLDCVAGVAGLIKTVLALRYGRIPPTLHFTAPNPDLDLPDSPFYVVAESTDWPAPPGQRFAGVTSLGIGGTNAHVILGEAPALPARESTAEGTHVFTVSARSPEALDVAVTNLRYFLEEHPEADPADVAYTLRYGRQAFPYQRAVAARTCTEAARALRTGDWLDPAADTGSAPGSATGSRRRVRLPAHPLLPKRYWPAREPERRTPEPVAARQEPTDDAFRTELTTELTEIIAARLRVAPETLRPDVPFADQGVDSLLVLRVLPPVEARYGCRIPVRQLLGELRTISDLAAYLRVNSTPRPPVPREEPSLARDVPADDPPAGSLLERLITEQLSLMRYQLELVGDLADREG